MKSTSQKNPSFKDFGSLQHVPDKVLKEHKNGLRCYRNMRIVNQAREDNTAFDIDQESCWMCWMDLTGNMLENWRKEPYSEVKTHSKKCPICGYPHWKGRVWYAFRFLRGYIGNPSSRHGIGGDKKK